MATNKITGERSSGSSSSPIVRPKSSTKPKPVNANRPARRTAQPRQVALLAPRPPATEFGGVLDGGALKLPMGDWWNSFRSMFGKKGEENDKVESDESRYVDLTETDPDLDPRRKRKYKFVNNGLIITDEKGEPMVGSHLKEDIVLYRQEVGTGGVHSLTRYHSPAGLENLVRTDAQSWYRKSPITDEELTQYMNNKGMGILTPIFKWDQEKIANAKKQHPNDRDIQAVPDFLDDGESS